MRTRVIAMAHDYVMKFGIRVLERELYEDVSPLRMFEILNGDAIEFSEKEAWLCLSYSLNHTNFGGVYFPSFVIENGTVEFGENYMAKIGRLEFSEEIPIAGIRIGFWNMTSKDYWKAPGSIVVYCPERGREYTSDLQAMRSAVPFDVEYKKGVFNNGKSA